MDSRRVHWVVLIGLLSVTAYAIADEVTLTTYYPSPRGVYDQLQARDYQDFDAPAFHVNPNGNSVMTNVALTNLDVTGTIANPTGAQLLLNDPNGIELRTTSPNAITIRGKVTGQDYDGTPNFFTVGNASGVPRFNIAGKLTVTDPNNAAWVMLQTDVVSGKRQVSAVNGKLQVEEGTGVRVNGDQQITGKLLLNGGLSVQGSAGVNGNLTVDGDTTLNNAVQINNKLTVDGIHTNGGIQVDGDFNVNGAKNFVQPHPTDPNKELVYTSLEGRDVRVFFDGVARLVNGEAIIDVPEDFRLVASPTTLNVVATPFDRPTSLYVAERSLDKITIRSTEGGSGEFGFLVMATRAGYEPSRPIQENVHFRPDGEHTLEQVEARLDANPPETYYGRLGRDHTRRLLGQNGLLRPDGKVNRELVDRLGWQYRDAQVAEVPKTNQENTSVDETAPIVR